MFTSIDNLKDAGFEGFVSITKLWNDQNCIPKEKGVYLVLCPNTIEKKFVPKGVGGFFKGKDPNAAVEVLNRKWINEASVIYIGQAGGNGSNANLQKRIKQYLDFGKGKPVGHYGGRYIWQLDNCSELLFCWKVTKEVDPRSLEKELLNEFISFYGSLPFANINS